MKVKNWSAMFSENAGSIGTGSMQSVYGLENLGKKNNYLPNTYISNNHL